MSEASTPSVPDASAAPETPTAATPPARIFPYPVERHTLANGLRVLMVDVPGEGLVSYWTVVRTGSRDEVEPGVTGFAHFFEHMMFRGSENFPAKEYDAIVKKAGADANAYTSDDYTAYHMALTTADLPRIIEIEADRFQRLSYDEGAFKTEAGAVYGEYRKGHTNPWEVLLEQLQNTAFDVHTYKHTTIGFEADIQKMPERYDYSKSFFKRFYRPENAIVAVVGAFDHAATLAAIEKHYGAWEKGYEPPTIPVEPEQTAARRVDVEFDGQTLPILVLAFKAPAFEVTSVEVMAGRLLGELAFGETSPFYKKLVLDEQRLDSLSANFESQRDPALWGVFALVKDAKDVSEVEREIWAEIAKIAAQPIDADKLSAVRSHLKYRFLSGLTSASEVAESLAPMIALTGDIEGFETYYATLMKVTPADVQAIAAKYLTRAHSTVGRLHTKGTALPAPPEPEVAVAPGQLKEAPVLMPVADDPNVAFAVWFKAGSWDDPPGKEGLANLTAQMLSEGGTKRLAYERILAALFPMAGAYSGTVDREMTVFQGQVHRDHAAEFADLFTAALTEPRFDEADFTRLRDGVVSYLENTLRFSSDEELGKAALYGAVFAKTSYQHVEEGTVASLSALTVDDVKQFWATHYTRETAVLGLGGSYVPALEARVRAALGKLPSGGSGAPVAPAVAPPEIRGRNVVIVQKPGASTAISIGYPIDVTRGTREFYALWVASSWLGEHRNSASHLYQVIREARGMNYGDYAYIEPFPDGGSRIMPPTGAARSKRLFEVWIRPVPEEQAVFALRAALREVELLATKGLTKEQFEETRNFLAKYVLHYAETTARRLGYALDDRYYGIENHLVTARKVLAELTFEDVNAAIKKTVRAGDLWIAMVSEHAAELKAALVADAPTPIKYPDGVEKPQAVLDEDKIIEAYPLAIQADHVHIVPIAEMFSGKARGSARASEVPW